MNIRNVVLYYRKIVKNILIVVIFLSNIFNSINAQEIINTHQAILNNIQGVVTRYKGSQIQISLEDTKNIPIKIYDYLKIKKNDTPVYLEINKVLDNYSKYYIQYVGYKRDGKQYIHCNFFFYDEYMGNWMENYIEVLDGGYRFWKIEYCIETKEFSNIEINGYA